MKKLINLLKKIQKDNKGVTLVELIVAVVVLSISIGPLLYTFVYSTRFNGESKVRQRSTNAAQTVMENFKAAELEDVYDIFTGASTAQFIRNSSATYTFTQSETDSTEFIGTYEVLGMNLSDVAGKESGTYDAVIEITPGYVSTAMPDVTVFDPGQDVLWQETNATLGSTYYSPYYVATQAVMDKVSSVGLDVANVTGISISRNITIDISDDGATIQYDFPYVISMPGNSPSTATGSITYSARSFASAEFTGNLRDVYFYYYPAYSSSFSGDSIVSVTGDYLTVHNTSSDNDTNLFVYKQIDSTRNYIDLKISENTYHLACIGTGSAITTVYDCIQANLADVSGGNYSTHMDSILEEQIGSGNIVLSTAVGPSASDILTYYIDVKIYKSGDRTDMLSQMYGTLLK